MRLGCSLLSLLVLLSAVGHFQQYMSPSTRFTKPGVYTPLTEKDMQCSSREWNRQTTLRCPSRDHELRDHHKEIPRNMTNSEFRQNYTKNMIAVYDGIDKNLFRRCTGLSYPLTPKDPSECWPVPVILPSYPTGGNGLFRSLLSELTAPLETSMVMYNSSRQLPTGLFRLGPHKDSTLIYGVLASAEALPLFRRIVLFKSHMGGKPDNPKQIENAKKLMVARQYKKLHGILRLARNPGDQLLRNHFRWYSKRCYQQGMECFMQRAHRICPALPDLAVDYAKFHMFWTKTFPDLPQHVAYYEHFTNKKHARSSIIGAMKFLDSLTPEDVDYERFYKDEDRIAKAIDVIREPSYEHGKVMVEVCGIDIARQVHERTKMVTEQLGYVFNDEDGTWSLEQHQESSTTTRI